MEEEKMLQKVKDGVFKLRTYWKVPPRGYDLSYKEFVSFSVGFGGISFLSVLISWTTLASGVFMMIKHFQVSSGLIFILGIVGSIIALIRAPILSMIIDNSRGKKEKFKPFVLWTMVVSCICFVIIPFIPVSLVSAKAISFTMTTMPIFGILEASTVTISWAVILIFVVIQVGTFFNTLATQAMTGIEQTISTVAQERANIGAFKGLICNIPSSVVNILIPMLAGVFFAREGVSGMEDIRIYQIFFPICAVLAIFCIIFIVKGTSERVVVNKKYTAKVKFFEGVKQLSKNKYFWIVTMYNAALAVRALVGITNWVCGYGIGGQVGDSVLAFCNIVLMNAFIPGMILGPMLVKKFGKRKVLATSNVVFAIFVVTQLLFVKNPYLILGSIFFQNLSGGFFFVCTVMASDALDYQQWKTGKRLEGFWQNYSSIIMTIIGFATTIISPIVLSMSGIGFGDVIGDEMKNPVKRNDAFFYTTLVALMGSILAMIPIFFYDLTEKKHANIVRVLKIRTAVDNFKAGELEDKDILNTEEIMKYAEFTKDDFVVQELNKYDCLEDIVATYDEVNRRVSIAAERQSVNDRIREMDFEERKLKSYLVKLDKTIAKKQKKDADYRCDTEKLEAEFIAKTRYLKDKEKYTTELSEDEDTTYARIEILVAEQNKNDFEQGCQSELKQLKSAVKKARNLAKIKKTSFDEEAFRENFIRKSTYIKKMSRFSEDV